MKHKTKENVATALMATMLVTFFTAITWAFFDALESASEWSAQQEQHETEFIGPVR